MMHNHLHLINFSKSYFILQDEKNYDLDGYNRFNINHKTIYFTKDFRYYSLSFQDYHIFILGELVDVRDSKKPVNAIVSDLLQYPIDSDSFLNEMSFFNGSYGLFIAHEENLYFYNDATSFLSLYYHNEKPVYASHSKLLHQLIQQIFGVEERLIKDKMRGFLDFSKFENIYKFNSNMRFELNHHELKRVYPIDDYQTQEIAHVVEQVIPLMTEMVAFVYRLDRPVVMSLTGGYDSRVSLALLKNKLSHTLFFTYLRTDEQKITRAQKNIYDTDQKAVQFLVDQLNLNHHFFNIDNNQGKKEVAELYAHYESSHSKNMINHYSQDAQFQGVAHVKSTIFELAKGIRPLKLEAQHHDIYDFVDELKKWSPIKEKAWIQQALTQFINRNALFSFLDKGYHPCDVLYLESKMNGWHSAIIQESDPYMDVYNLINCRFILFQLICMNYEDRKNLAFHKSVIEQRWPLLHFFGVNTKVNLYEKYQMIEKQLEECQTNKINAQSMKLSYETQDFNRVFQQQRVHFKLKRRKFVESERYHLNIENQSGESVQISMRTFYKNNKGRARIFITIDNMKYDIVDLAYESVEKSIAPGSKMCIAIQSTKDIDKKSWIEAAKFEIKEIYANKKVIE
ncbi:hypothetical protein AB5O29_001932 [Staphylococcus pseudintermedius]